MTAPATPTPLKLIADVMAIAPVSDDDDWAMDTSALATVRDLIEAALALDAYRVEADAAGWPDWDARFEVLEAAAAAYRAWAPTPDAGTGDGGGE